MFRQLHLFCNVLYLSGSRCVCNFAAKTNAMKRILLVLFLISASALFQDSTAPAATKINCMGQLGPVSWVCYNTADDFCSRMNMDGTSIECRGYLVSIPDIPRPHD